MHAIGVGAGVLAAVLTSVPLLIAASLGAPPATTCVAGFSATGKPDALHASAAAAGLDANQLGHAATIIAVGRGRAMPERGIVIALAIALQESRLRVYANDGTGDLAADQRGIAASLGLPHDAVGRDHGSLGIFQQQWPWWGSMEELMDPATSARIFYDALSRVPGWEALPLTVAAQTVQHSAYPSAYADDEPLATLLLHEVGGGVVSVGTDCATFAAAGDLRFPLPANSGYVDQHNFADSGPSWSSWHTGTDFSVACSTPVYAAHAGTVHVVTNQPWAGPWLVQVEVGPGRLTTWYAHMQQVAVADGASVAQGQTIGAVGALGNASGCHLHFEVHPRGGSIYEDPIDPSAWLAENTAKSAA